MPIEQDITFGICYLTVEEFLASAPLFGVSTATIPTDDGIIKAYLAAASRWIDAKTCKNFTPNVDHVEQHTLNSLTGRLIVNNPPVLSISDYRILTGPTTFSSINVNNLLINNQESWIELLTQPFIFPGMNELIIQITYKSAADVKQNIKLATGYIAAAMIFYSLGASQSLPGNIKSIKIGQMAQVVAREKSEFAGVEVPVMVELLLANDVAIGIA